MMNKLAMYVAGPRTKWATLIVWLVVAIVLTITLPSVKQHERNNAPNLPEEADSVVASQIIAEQFPGASGIPALVVWSRATGLTDEDYSVIQSLAAELEKQPPAALQQSVPLHQMPPIALQQMTSEDGTVFIQPLLFEEDAVTETLKASIQHIQQQVTTDEQAPFAAELGEKDVLTARISGPAGILVDATDLFKNADFVLMVATVLLVLVLLLFIYRSPILAIIPLIGVGFAYLVTSPILGWLAANDWIVIDSQATAIMTVLLFGAGTDYCLFYITRFRHELQQTATITDAIKQTFRGASGAIAMSGFTVVLALLSLLAAEYGSYQRFAIPFSLSIFIMGIASLTLVPALLAIIGRKSFFPFIPRTPEMIVAYEAKTGKRVKRKDPERTLGNRVGNLVVRKPWQVVMTCTILLVTLALFAISIPYKYDLLSSFPDNMPSKQGYEQIAQAFEPGELAPVTIVMQHQQNESSTDTKTDTDANAREQIEQQVKTTLEQMPQVGEVSAPVQGVNDTTYTSFTVILHTNPYEQEAMDAIPKLRLAAAEVLLENKTASSLEAAQNMVWIGGQTAEQYDNRELNSRDNKVVMPLVIVLITILLFIYLRSLWATIYLVATVLLSFVSALGLGWLILHYGFGVEALQGAIPLYAFVFLIALGEDYNIFMVSSIWKKSKEMLLKQAIKEGVSQTGSVITSAGLILAATFAVLATLPLQVLMQFGLITALGVLLDTFIVRPFLVPAITTLVGERVFWPGKRPEVAPKINVVSQDRT
ncbi:MMPL family transporter [Paenibacillus yanchengensis]|uniref:MMPL family transporter n=1 Tax=Paenibacillus yanchengensis TaxID=2035833 RepID=A0ABW4YPX1_9BACL